MIWNEFTISVVAIVVFLIIYTVCDTISDIYRHKNKNK